MFKVLPKMTPSGSISIFLVLNICIFGEESITFWKDILKTLPSTDKKKALNFKIRNIKLLNGGELVLREAMVNLEKPEEVLEEAEKKI